MRIVLVTNRLDVGGIEMNIVRLTRAYVARGHHVVVASRVGALTPSVQEAGATHLPLSVQPLDPRRLAADRVALRAAAAGGIDLVHVFSAGAALTVAAAFAGRRRRPVVVSSIMGIRNAPDEASWRVLARAFATTIGVDLLIVTSPAIAELVDRLPRPRLRYERGNVVGVEIPPSPSPEHVLATRRNLGLGPDDRMVLTIGRLEPSKSHELFVRAAAHVPPEACFFIVGGGALDDELRAEIRSAGLTGRVSLLGEQLDVTPLIAAADVYVRPGVVEGFVGITVLEAQALGVPVVSFETEDVRIAIEDGETGILVTAGDVEGLGRAISALLADPERAARIGEAGRRRVVGTFGIDAVVTALLGRYAALSEPR